MAQAMQLLKGTTVPPDTSSVPDNCIILKGGVLECRDSLEVFLFLIKVGLSWIGILMTDIDLVPLMIPTPIFPTLFRADSYIAANFL